jgi:hypothetical protein
MCPDDRATDRLVRDGRSLGGYGLPGSSALRTARTEEKTFTARLTLIESPISFGSNKS